jgi:hypothetical protein
MRSNRETNNYDLIKLGVNPAKAVWSVIMEAANLPKSQIGWSRQHKGAGFHKVSLYGLVHPANTLFAFTLHYRELLA